MLSHETAMMESDSSSVSFILTVSRGHMEHLKAVSLKINNTLLVLPFFSFLVLLVSPRINSTST